MKLVLLLLILSTSLLHAGTPLPAFGDATDLKIVWSERSQTKHGEIMRLRFHTGRQFNGHVQNGVSQFFEKQLTAAGWHESEADTSNEVFVSAWQSPGARLLLSILQLDAHSGDYFAVLETITY